MEEAAYSHTTSKVYQSRRPEKTLLYQLLQENMNTWLLQTQENGGSIAPYVEKDFSKYLECGILSYGFARARCECGHEFLVAFSCKGRGICPSCNTRHMAETAAHLVDHVFPRVPVRQWVLSLPKRLRYYLYHDPKIASKVLKIFLDEINKQLKQHIDIPSGAIIKAGGVSFIHRFGATLNVHLHFHCVVMEGLFMTDSDGQLSWHPVHDVTETDIQAVQQRVRIRVLKAFKRWKLLEDYEADNMKTWQGGGGFSVDGSVKIHQYDRNGLERLLRYCARPLFASDRLEKLSDNRLIYKPTTQWKTAAGYKQHPIYLSPLEFIEKIALLIPPPRKHRHRYFGVLAPNSPYREPVTARAAQDLQEGDVPVADNPEESEIKHKPGAARMKNSFSHYLWAILIARIYEVLPLICPDCGGQMKIISFIQDKPTIKQIISHIGEPTEPPIISPARAPPLWDDIHTEPDAEIPMVDIIPDYEFDQRISW